MSKSNVGSRQHLLCTAAARIYLSDVNKRSSVCIIVIARGRILKENEGTMAFSSSRTRHFHCGAAGGGLVRTRGAHSHPQTDVAHRNYCDCAPITLFSLRVSSFVRARVSGELTCIDSDTFIQTAF